MLIMMIPCWLHDDFHENQATKYQISMFRRFIESFLVRCHALQIIMTSYGLNSGHLEVNKGYLGSLCCSFSSFLHNQKHRGA